MASPKLLKGRISLVGHIYAVTTVTAGRRPFLTDPVSVGVVMDALRHCDRVGVSRSLAWVVMPDHLHWLLQLRAGTLAECLQRLKSRSSRGMGVVGATWQAGYHDHALRSAECMKGMARYLLQNPVRAGLCDWPEAYPYSWCRWGREV